MPAWMQVVENPTVGALSDARAITDAYMEVGGRAKQELLPRRQG